METRDADTLLAVRGGAILSGADHLWGLRIQLRLVNNMGALVNNRSGDVGQGSGGRLAVARRRDVVDAHRRSVLGHTDALTGAFPPRRQHRAVVVREDRVRARVQGQPASSSAWR